MAAAGCSAQVIRFAPKLAYGRGTYNLIACYINWGREGSEKVAMSMQSKLNTVEGIDQVSQTLAVELGVGGSRLGKKREGKAEE